MNFYNYYPDNNQPKEVFVQAAGHTRAIGGARHALITWKNGDYVVSLGAEPQIIRQIVQMEMDSRGYFYDSNPCAKKQGPASTRNNQFYSLGFLTRAQRDRILALAQAVRFRANSQVNGCRVWLRDLLEKMVNEAVISKATFDYICNDVPLPARQYE
ncbi:hypothetical protein FPV67DRAFT_1416717 [Lyophyllum atratum]|nr:hypothetical protein FPV67DRAFT_1416717 [Lyophyllum atratum]